MEQKERYKEVNKALLEISPLAEDEKEKVSVQIDLNAEEQKEDMDKYSSSKMYNNN